MSDRALAEDLYTEGTRKFGDENWVMNLGLGQAQFANGKKKIGLKTAEKALSLAPERSKGFAESAIATMK